MQLNDAQQVQTDKLTETFELLVQVQLDAGDFSADWSHCDRLATYVARMVSHNRADSLQYANLFSTAFNELLETAFRNHRKEGQIICAVLRSGAVDRIELTIPCDATIKDFYIDAVQSLAATDFAKSYVSALLSDGPLDPRIGLLELAVDYNARLSLKQDVDVASPNRQDAYAVSSDRQNATQTVCLVAEFTLDAPIAQGNE